MPYHPAVQWCRGTIPRLTGSDYRIHGSCWPTFYPDRIPTFRRQSRFTALPCRRLVSSCLPPNRIPLHFQWTAPCVAKQKGVTPARPSVTLHSGLSGTSPPVTPSLSQAYRGPIPCTFTVVIGGSLQAVTAVNLKQHLGPAPVSAASPLHRGSPPHLGSIQIPPLSIGSWLGGGGGRGIV